MKRNFLTLALAGAFGLALIGSASLASAACPAGATNGGLIASNYAVRIQGFQTDTGTCFGGSTCPDPTPVPVAGIGVVAIDGTCDITAGELIYDNGGTYSAPTSINLGAGSPFVPAFAGTMTAADTGSAVFDSNNSGVLTLVDTTSSHTWVFGVTAETGGSEIRGALMSPGDPVTIVLERQHAVVIPTTFISTIGLDFDWGVGFPTQATGVGGGAIQTEVVEHLDPETSSTLEGGGSIFFNVDNGYDSTFAPGLQILPPGGGGLVCDFSEALISAPGANGTQNTDAALNGDFSCPLAPAHFENASVVWGSTNQAAWVLTTGSDGVASTGVSMGTAGKATAPGTDHMSPGAATLHSTGATVTATITNDTAEPLSWSSIALSAGFAGYATITGGTCATGASDLAAWNPLIGPPNTCTVILKDSGTVCTAAGPGHIVGTLLIAANDHVIAATTQGASGATIPVTCTH